MTLPSHEYRDELPGTGCVPELFAGTLVVLWGLVGSARRLRRRALAQYSRLLFSILDGLCVGGHRVGARSPRNFQGHWTSRGTTRPFRRQSRNCLRRHLCDLVDLAVLNKPL
jgi:hypothetical protein